MENNAFLISTALNFNISDRRIDYKTFSILHIIEHCFVSYLIRQNNDYRIYSRISGKTNNYNLNIEINTLTTLNRLTAQDNIWNNFISNFCFDCTLFDEQKENVIQEIKNNFSSYKKNLITINNIISIESIIYPSLAQIKEINYGEFIKEYNELLLTERYISTCYGQNSLITDVSKSKVKNAPVSVTNYKSIYRVNTDDSSGNWLMFLFKKTNTVDEYISKEITLNCFNYILKCYLKENKSEFMIVSKSNDNIASYLLIKIDDQYFCQEKLINFMSEEKLAYILTEEIYLNIVDDFRISFMFLMESCRSRNGMIQKLYSCFGELPKEKTNIDIEKYLYGKDRIGVINRIINTFDKTIKIIFSDKS